MRVNDEKVEAAAKAMYELRAKIDDPFWEGGKLDYGIKQIYRQDARDALLAADAACCAHPKCPGGSLCCCQSDAVVTEEAHDEGMDAVDWDMVRDGVGDPQEAASIAVRAALEAALAVRRHSGTGVARPVIGREALIDAIAARHWDQDSGEVEDWRELTQAEKENVIDNYLCPRVADAVIAHLDADTTDETEWEEIPNE